jgi:hypothetical protein
LLTTPGGHDWPRVARRSATSPDRAAWYALTDPIILEGLLMTTTDITLSPDELALLLRLLETELGETLVELHHTRFSPEFRQQVKDEAEILRGLLEQLRKAATER